MNSLKVIYIYHADNPFIYVIQQRGTLFGIYKASKGSFDCRASNGDLGLPPPNIYNNHING